jgi:undecaprenyl-diphosphatase
MQATAPTGPSLATSIDRRIFDAIHGIPHTPVSDRYVSMISDIGEGLLWVGLGIGLAALGGRKGQRAGLATSIAALGTTYVVQRLFKPMFRRQRPFVNRELTVVGIRTSDASFPSGHSAASFAAATALTTFYPSAAPLAYGVAGLVGASRVHLGHHFPSDVAVGAMIGVGTGTLTSAIVRRLR